jgi:membrane-bound lytic murein transglycosylase B
VRRFAFGVVLVVLATLLLSGGASADAAGLGERQAVESGGETSTVKRNSELVAPRDQASREADEEAGEAAAAKEAEEEEEEAAEEEAEAEAEESSAEEETAAGEEGAEGALSSLDLGDGSSILAAELEVPTALLPVYEACGTRYGISWEVLAAINKVETGFGTDLGTSGAGAEGWMQFLPQSWKEWGIDADGDGTAGSDDPVDAICSAARYLAASGGEEDIYDAVLAYNHADWYAKEVLSLAREYERVPANLVNALSELATGSTSPVAGASSSSNHESVGEDGKTAAIGAAKGAAVRAVVDGTVAKVGDGSIVLTDAYGDQITYSGLGSTAVKEGDEVEAGDSIGNVGDTAIGFRVRPDASTAIDPTELLSIWKQGGVGDIYGVDGEADGAVTTSEGAAPIRALLMSSDALRREVLADPDLELPSCVRKAVAEGGLQRQSLAALEYRTATGHRLGVAASTCAHSTGFVIDLDSVDGEAKTVELDYRPPSKATIVDGDAVAPTDAPAAVQAMIAAANQIDETPYVWGGGHGSWASSGYDCSGSVSYVLHAAKMLSSPQVSGALASWGESGTGNWVTVYANGEHTYMVIAGLRWDTVGDASGTGPRWHTGAAYPEGFAVRHPAGL